MEQLKIIFADTALPLLSPDEIYQMADQSLLFILKEDKRIERKPANTHARQLGEYHSMWANTVPDGGLLALGMEDNGSFSGCSRLSQSDLNDREKSSHIYCPECRSESKRIKVFNTKGQEDFIVLFRTYYREDKVVHDVSGEAYIRIGDEKHKLSPEEIHELKIDRGQVDLEQEPTTLQFPENFRDDLIRTFVEGVHKIRSLSDLHSDEEILVHRKLGKMIKGNFVPNNACVLLFARAGREKLDRDISGKAALKY